MSIELGDYAREGMFRFTVENVREALPRGVGVLLRHGERQDSRNGPVILYPEGPVAITYRQPQQRVLLNPIRDANPFFHLVEAMWMLAGREDAAPLDVYIKDFGKRFGYHGVITDGYGYRWRKHWDFDQLDEMVHLLRRESSTRRAVLSMWDPEDLTTDLAKPCNLMAVFRTRYGCLDMTVFNRSNDILWGAFGANAVHFSFLHEYVARRVGADIGWYTQITNDFHMYEAEWDKLKARAKLTDKSPPDTVYMALSTGLEAYGPETRLIDDPLKFDDDLRRLWVVLDKVHSGKLTPPFRCLTNPFLESVYWMACAYLYHKRQDRKLAIQNVLMVAAPDWQQAGVEWLQRRWKKDLTASANTDKTVA